MPINIPSHIHRIPPPATIVPLVRPPSDRTIEEAEYLLGLAKEGKIVSVVATYEFVDGEVGSLMTGTHNQFKIVGMLVRLVHRIMGDMDDRARTGKTE